MNAESLEKLIFTHIRFNMKIELEKDDEWNRKKQTRSSKRQKKYAHYGNRGEKKSQ